MLVLSGIRAGELSYHIRIKNIFIRILSLHNIHYKESIACAKTNLINYNYCITNCLDIMLGTRSYSNLIREKIASDRSYKRIISAYPHIRKSSPAHIVLIHNKCNDSYSLETAFDVRYVKDIVVGGVYVHKPFYALQQLLELFRSTYESPTQYSFKGDPIGMLILMQSVTEQYRC